MCRETCQPATGNLCWVCARQIRGCAGGGREVNPKRGEMEVYQMLPSTMGITAAAERVGEEALACLVVLGGPGDDDDSLTANRASGFREECGGGSGDGSR